MVCLNNTLFPGPTNRVASGERNWEQRNSSGILSPIYITACIYHVPAAVFGPGDTVVIKKNAKTFALLKLIFYGGTQTIDSIHFIFISFYFFTDSRKRGREGEREGEKHRCERETLIGCLLHVPQLGTKLATQVWALTGNHWQPFGLQDNTQPTEPQWPGR